MRLDTKAPALAKAQQVVTEKYRQYEELASRWGEGFHPDCVHPGPGAGTPV